MLVLSRKNGERIRLGDNIILTVVRIGPNVVRLGIDAPKELTIMREEVVPDVTGCDDCVKGVDKPLDDCELA